MKYISLLLVFALNSSFASIPENQLRYSAYDKSTNGISHYKYQELQNQVLAAFEGILKKQYAKTLIFEDAWDDDKVNAYCTRDLNDNPVIKVMGGMARHPDLTPDGFLVIVCHELGHFLGGAPKAPRGNSGKLSWSSVEGQADYFATAKCLPKIFKDQKENREIIKSVPGPNLRKAQKRCGKENALCIRVSMAALSASKVFHSTRDFEDYPDLGEVDEGLAYDIEFGHPTAQCRLDTLINGINCADKHNVMFDESNPKVGVCEVLNSARPACWYSP